jgi:hypothetical protein
MFAILWPVTIPARAALGTWKTGKFFADGVDLSYDPEFLYFAGETGSGMKLRLANVRAIQHRHDFLLLRFGIGDFVAIPTAKLAENEPLLTKAIAEQSPLVAATASSR